jgi:hypothetical protein
VDGLGLLKPRRSCWEFELEDDERQFLGGRRRVPSDEYRAGIIHEAIDRSFLPPSYFGRPEQLEQNDSTTCNNHIKRVL